MSSHSCERYLEDVTAPTVPAQQPQASKNWPASLYRRPDGVLEQDISPARIREILQAGDGDLWVDIDSTNMHQLALLEKVFAFHPLSIEDTLSPGTRVKFEEYERYVFVVMAVIRFDEGTPEPYDLATSNLYFFLGKNFLATVHALTSKSGAIVRERLVRNHELHATIDVSYQSEPLLGCLVPIEMREDYQDRRGSHITGAASYGRFRQFQVDVDERFTPILKK